MAWPLIGREVEQDRIRRTLDDPDLGGVALVGGPGVGTTRLLEEAVDHAGARGWVVRVLRATNALRSVPFGVIDADPGSEFVALERELREAADGATVLLAIDDADRLDDASLALVERLAGRRWVRVALTVRDAGTDARLPTPAMSLAVVPVAPLGREDHDALVVQATRRSVTHHASQALWDHTRGRPRDLALLLDALAGADRPVRDGLVWHWSGGPVDSVALRVLAGDELGALDPSARQAYELVAVAHPVPLEVARAVISDRDLERLERAGLVEEIGVEEIGAEEIGVEASTAVRPTRPVVAAVVAGRLAPAARRRHAAALAACRPGPDDWWRLHHVEWCSIAGSTDEAAVPATVRAALDRSEVGLAERLCRGALAHDDDHEMRLLLAECLRRQGRATEAVAELQVASGSARSDEERALVAVRRAQVATLLQADPGAALAALDEALAHVAERGPRARLERERRFVGAFVEVVEPPGPPDGTGGTSPDTEIGDLLLTALLQSLNLDHDHIDDVLGRCAELARRDDLSEPMVGARLGVCRHLTDTGRGAIGSAHRRARAGLAAAARDGEPTGLWALCVAFTGPLVGDLDAAAVAAFDADESFRVVDPYGLRPFAASIGAAAAHQAGRHDMAVALTGAMASGSGADPRIREIGGLRVAAWESLTAGRLDDAVVRATEAGRIAMEAGHRLWGVIALHEPVRWGVPSTVVDLLAEAAEATATTLAEVCARHGAALVGGSGDDLDRVAAGFAAMGCPLLAAEAAMQAARRHPEPAAARAATRAELWSEGCTGRSPVSRPGPAGLTDRQREVARLAALGHASREIAEDLVLSARTVDNHLRIAYRRLGVSGRTELASVLAPALLGDEGCPGGVTPHW